MKVNLKFWEKRSTGGTNSSYTDTLIRTIIARAGGSTANPAATGALEIASGVIARAFMNAEVSGAASLVPLLSPPLLSMMARELVRRGEWFGLIEIKDGRPMLYPAAYVTINGGYDPDTWSYELTLAGPDRTSTLYKVSAAQVVHVRYSVDPERPWRGVGPVQAAALAGRLSAETLEALGDEISGPRGSFLPTPTKDGQDDSLSDLRADVRKAAGSMLFVESMANEWEGGSSGRMVPRDWEQKRFGAEIPSGMVTLNETVTREILGCCGVSPTLFEPRSSAAAREAWRTLLFGTIAPLGRLVEHELSQKLMPVTLGWRELRASDLQGRARSVKSLVDAGLERDKALELAGLSEN